MTTVRREAVDDQAGYPRDSAGRSARNDVALRLGLLALSIYMGCRTIVDVIRRPPSDSVLSYWTFKINADTYSLAPHTYAAHQYPPIFGQVIAPLTALPMREFMAVWGFLSLALLLFLVKPRWFGLVLLSIPAQWAVWNGNVQLMYAAVAVVGLRYPAMWAIPLLTKVTPGIGLIWFLVRREWRSLAIALGFTAAIVAASFVKAPDAWFSWVAFMRSGAPDFTSDASVPVAFPLRLAFCAILVTLGARKGWTWVLPVALWLAEPAAWWLGAWTLAAIPRLIAAADRGSVEREAAAEVAIGPDDLEVRGVIPDGVRGGVVEGRA